MSGAKAEKTRKGLEKAAMGVASTGAGLMAGPPPFSQIAGAIALTVAGGMALGAHLDRKKATKAESKASKGTLGKPWARKGPSDYLRHNLKKWQTSVDQESHDAGLGFLQANMERVGGKTLKQETIDKWIDLGWGPPLTAERAGPAFSRQLTEIYQRIKSKTSMPPIEAMRDLPKADVANMLKMVQRAQRNRDPYVDIVAAQARDIVMSNQTEAAAQAAALADNAFKQSLAYWGLGGLAVGAVIAAIAYEEAT